VEERVVLLAALKRGARERALELLEKAADREDHEAEPLHSAYGAFFFERREE
jgi:hypothetical protein